MTVAIIAGVLGLVAALIAFYRDAPIEEHRAVEPDWDLLPDPSDVARTEFPMAIPGYEAATVELHFDLLTRAYADLLASATPDVIARARHRAAVRRGIEPPDDDAVAPSPASTPVAPRPARSTLASPQGSGGDEEALAAEAALADLDTQRGRKRT